MKAKIQFRSVKTRLTSWFLLVALVPLITVTVVIYIQRVHSIKEEAFSKLRAIGNLKVNEVNVWLDARIGDIRTISEDFEIRALEEAIYKTERTKDDSRAISNARRLLSRYLKNYRDYDEVFIINPTSGIIEISTDTSHEGEDKSKDPYFSEPLQSRQVFIKDIYLSKTLNVPSMSFSIAIHCLSHNGEHISGILVARVDLKHSLYALLLNRTGMGNTGETLIVSKDVVALNELRWYEHAPLRLRIEAKPALRASQGETGITETEDYRGEKVLAAYSYIPKTGWGFVAKQDLREVYAPIRSLLWNVLILLLISAMVVYGLAILLARNIARPVFEMAEVSKKIQEGDFSARNRVQSADELGYLAETFNTMADSISSQMDLIKKAEDQLRRERDSLEEQVQERTLDLQQELDERKRAEEALRESEERFRSFIDSATDGFTLLDSELNYIEINKSGLEIIGLDRKYFMGKNIVDVVPDIKKTGRYDKYKKVIKTSVPLLVSDLIPNPKFGNKHIELKAFKVGDGLGIIFTDITERERAKEQIKASLREKEVLLREIHHRVKNNMQVIISLLRLQSDYTKEKQYSEMLEDSQSRIKSMALIHEKLYQSEDLTNIDFNGYVKDLGNRLFGSHGVSPEKIALNIEIEDVSLGLENAIPCGLIINELVSNSLKHAFPQEREGEIRITLRSINGDEIELTVSDNGVGIPEDLDLRNTESLGLHLVTILSEDQLDGKIELNRTGGTKFHIQFKRETYRGRV